MLKKIKEYFVFNTKQKKMEFIPRVDRTIYNIQRCNRNNSVMDIATGVFSILGIFLVITAIIGLVIGLWLFIPFLLWLGWKLVMGYFWVGGPPHLIDPNFWYFLVAFYILAILFGGFRISFTIKK